MIIEKKTVFEIFLLKYWSLKLLYKPHNENLIKYLQ